MVGFVCTAVCFLTRKRREVDGTTEAPMAPQTEGPDVFSGSWHAVTRNRSLHYWFEMVHFASLA